MPWHKGRHESCNKAFAVIKDDDGSLAGCHDTEAEADAQLAALYASEDDDMGEQVERTSVNEAEWTRAYINDLPDASFALILPGGEKDDQGKTAPRDLRKLPYKDAGGKVDVAHLRNALSRAPQMEDVTDAQRKSAIAKLQAIAKEHLATYQQEVAQIVELALRILDGGTKTGDAAAVQESADQPLAERASGRVIAMETSEVQRPNVIPLTLDVAIIEPGPGNKGDGHYYPKAMLRRDAGVFKGAHMYATDHRESEKSVGTWVSTIKSCPVGFTETGAPIARVVVHKEWFAKDVLALAKSGMLNEMQCSILGKGRAKEGKIDGETYNIVEAITEADAVDWVTRAGAGGRALALAESDAAPQNNGSEEMDENKEHGQDQEHVQEAQPVTLKEDTDTDQPQPEAALEGETEQEPEQDAETADHDDDADGADDAADQDMLPADQVDEMLKASGLGEDAQRLLRRPYADENAVNAAISEFKRIIKRATASGQPFEQGAPPARPLQESAEEREARAKQDYAAIKERWGGRTDF